MLWECLKYCRPLCNFPPSRQALMKPRLCSNSLVAKDDLDLQIFLLVSLVCWGPRCTLPHPPRGLFCFSRTVNKETEVQACRYSNDGCRKTQRSFQPPKMYFLVPLQCCGLERLLTASCVGSLLNSQRGHHTDFWSPSYRICIGQHTRPQMIEWHFRKTVNSFSNMTLCLRL